MGNVTDTPNLIGKILACLNAGGRVSVGAVLFDRSHVDWFRKGRDGKPYARKGAHWQDISDFEVTFHPAAGGIR